MLTLYTHTGACATALHIMLEKLWMDYKAIEVTFWDPEYKKINPKGSVPALKDSELGDDIVITQLPAIAKYILRKKFGNLYENKSYDEAKIDSMLSLLGADIHTSFAPLFAPHAFTTATDENALNQVKEAGVNRVFHNLEFLDTLLEGKKYFIDDNIITIADLYAYVITTWAEMFLPEKFTTLSNLVRFNKEISELPEVKKVYGK